MYAMERGVTAFMPRMLAICPRVGALFFFVRFDGGAVFSMSISQSMSRADVGDVKINLNA